MSSSLMRRQMLVERFLVDVLQMDWATVHDEAERVVTAVSPHVEERICRLLDDPGTCPHGNPIPGSRHLPDQSGAVPLSEVLGLVTVTRIDDAIEGNHVAMQQLQASGVTPGELAEVVGHGPDGTSVIGSVADAILPATTARHVHVTPRRP